MIKGQTRAAEETSCTGISPALAGAPEARAALDKAIAEYDRANEDLYVILYLLTEEPAAPLVSKHEGTTGTSGSGQPALLDLVGRYNKVADGVIRSTMNRLLSSTMKQGHFFRPRYLGTYPKDFTVVVYPFYDHPVEDFYADKTR